MNFFKKSVFGIITLAAVSFADNPISSYHYNADPAAIATDDTFYIIADVDDENNPSDGSKYNGMKYLYAFSSKDMKNWTDHGMILSSEKREGVDGRTYDGESGFVHGGIWASGITIKDGVFYIIHTNGGGVGLVASKDIAGPYKDPVGKYLVSWDGLVNCGNIAWCFDPGIFVDDDGKAYMTYGGGQEDGKQGYGENFDIFPFDEFSYDKVSISEANRHSISGTNKSFEASYIHKRNGIYYLSYNDQSQAISYATSKNIYGPYTYQGVFIENPAKINGKGGNNHHGVAKFKDKWYAVYHERRLVASSEAPMFLGATSLDGGNHRSTSIDELKWTGDKMDVVEFSEEGPAQISNFDPYQTYKALTSSKQRNVRSRTLWAANQPVTHVLLPLTTKESWIRVSGVDFGTGAAKFSVTAGSEVSGNKVEIHTGSANGALAGSCEIPKTSKKTDFKPTECEMDPTVLKGVVDQLFLVFKGSQDSTMGITHWEFIPKNATPRAPFGGKAWSIPGKIQAEDFDVPGTGIANKTYSDKTVGNAACEKGSDSECSTYREDTDVDIKKVGSGHVIGWNEEGEWLEYTVDVAETGDYTMYAAVAANGSTSSFKLSVDGIDLTKEPLAVPAAVKLGDSETEVYDDFNKVKANVYLTAGEHILRVTVVGSWFDFDYFNFEKGKDTEDSSPVGEEEHAESSSAVADGSSASTESSNSSVVESSSSALVNSSASVVTSSSSSATTDLTAIIAPVRVGFVPGTYKVFDAQGKFLGNVNLVDSNVRNTLKNANYKAGVYILRGKGVSLKVNTIK